MAPMKFDVLNRFGGAVQFTAEIDCDKNSPIAVKLGLAVQWAVRTGAYLAGANLAGADLAGAYLARANLADANLAGAYLARANLAGANLAGADLARAYLAGAYLAGANLADANLARAYLAGAPIIDGGLRSDGYRFFYSAFPAEGPLIQAGCHRFASFADAREYWKAARGGTLLGDETFAILDHLERMATIRNILHTAKNMAA